MLSYKKPSNELVYDLINLANPDLPIPVDANNVIIEKITDVAVNAASNNRNTSARLRGVQGMGYTDSITLYYDRIDLKAILPLYTQSKAGFTTFTATNVHSALAAIEEAFGVKFGTMDVVNSALPGANTPDYTYQFSLAAQPASPAYRGSQAVRYYRGKPVLDTSITKDALDVLKHPIDETLGKKCIDLLTYGIDFTAYKNLLNVTSAGLPNWAGLRQVLDSLGIPQYDGPLNSNTVQDVATSTMPSANKNFDRVVVQTGIDAEGVKGVAYYHYNS